jgi:hypothetical protein
MGGTASTSTRCTTCICWSANQEPLTWPGRSALRRARPEGATREFVRILQLHVRYEVDVLATALERALALGCWSADGVEQLVRQALAPESLLRPAAAVIGPCTPFPEMAIPLPDLHRFDGLLREVGS